MANGPRGRSGDLAIHLQAAAHSTRAGELGEHALENFLLETKQILDLLRANAGWPRAADEVQNLAVRRPYCAEPYECVLGSCSRQNTQYRVLNEHEYRIRTASPIGCTVVKQFFVASTMESKTIEISNVYCTHLFCIFGWL